MQHAVFVNGPNAKTVALCGLMVTVKFTHKFICLNQL
jgi:hypothetical protein